MRLALSCTIIQCHVSAQEGDALRLMMLPKGFRKQRVPSGWQIVQLSHRWYYGLRILEEEMPLGETGERVCTSL